MCSKCTLSAQVTVPLKWVLFHKGHLGIKGDQNFLAYFNHNVHFMENLCLSHGKQVWSYWVC